MNNPPKDAVIGGTVFISFVVEKRENVLVLSKDMLHNNNGSNYVLMLEKGLKVQRNVELGLENGTEAEITKGLVEGEKVIK